MYENTGTKPGAPKRDQIQQRWKQLQNDRSSWFAHWKEISTYLLPRSGRFFEKDENRGGKKHHNIYDSTGTWALRVLSAGMMAGMTSPARPWFRLTTPDPDLAQRPAVKHWLNDVTEQMRNVLSRSNTYGSLHSLYGELGAFGTASNIILPNFNNVVHQYPLTIGEYALATDYDGNVNTLYREFRKPVSEIVQQFGLENCSHTVRNMYSKGQLDQRITLIHAIEPRADRDPKMRDAKNMPWRSCYIEKGGDEGKYLRESGFKRFRALCPRWDTVSGDTYGHSPGMESLGDIKQLQHEQLRKAQGIDYKTKPPLQVPTSLAGQGVDSLPGGTTFVDVNNPQGGIRTAFEVNLDLSHLLEDIRDVRERIRAVFYADLFLMLSSQPVSNMTATEVAERHEEKLLMLGPVLERLHNELLSPLIDMTFEDMMMAGVVPTPPEELQGHDIKVEFVSVLAQAQRAVATNSIDRFVMNLGTVATVKPEVVDKLDPDMWADKYADMLGVDPELIVPNDRVALIRQQRAEAEQATAQREAMQQEADTARSLSQADTGGDNALSSVMDMFSGYNA